MVLMGFEISECPIFNSCVKYRAYSLYHFLLVRRLYRRFSFHLETIFPIVVNFLWSVKQQSYNTLMYILLILLHSVQLSKENPNNKNYR